MRFSSLLFWQESSVRLDLRECPQPPMLHSRITRTFSRPDTAAITEPRVRSVVDGFLGVGDSVFAMSQSAIVNSPYFKKGS